MFCPRVLTFHNIISSRQFITRVTSQQTLFFLEENEIAPNDKLIALLVSNIKRRSFDIPFQKQSQLVFWTQLLSHP